MSLLESINLSDLKRLTGEEIKSMKSCEVMKDGEYLFTMIIPQKKGGDIIFTHVKTKAEYLGENSNSVGGKQPSEVLASKERHAVV